MKSRRGIIALLACSVLLAAAIAQLFVLRFEAGDVYPPYSSLRSDPLGTMALYESLGKVAGISARRDFSASNQLPDGRDTAYLHLAGDIDQWTALPADTFREIDQFLSRGGRLVVVMYPEPVSRFSPSRSRAGMNDGKKNKSSDPKARRDKKNVDESMEPKDRETNAPPSEGKSRRFLRNEEDDDMPGQKHVTLADRWGVEFGMEELVANEDSVYQPVMVTKRTSLAFPDRIEWHSGAIFKKVSPSWRTIYARDSNPVMIEREFGRGSVVLATDSYYLSNEAMLKNRHAELIGWLLGPAKTIYFDEAHLGIVESSGVSMLMRKYRLEGVVAVLILLAGLFVWKNSTSLAPFHAAESSQNIIAGKESSAGLVNLLRRGIPPDALLAACFAEWKKSVAGTRKHSPGRIRQVEREFQIHESLHGRDRNPIQLYRNISKILDTKQ